MLYWMRTLNGISHVAYGGLGHQALVETPFVANEVVTGSLRISLADKMQHPFREALIARVNPEVAAIPSNHDRVPARTGLPIRRKHPLVLRGFRELLADGPLAPWIPDDVWNSVAEGEYTGNVKPRHINRTTLGIATYHLWVRRYGSQVRDADPAEALDIAHGG